MPRCSKTSSKEGGGALDLFTWDTHESLRRGLVILGVVSLVLFIPLILFSYRFGRLGNTGCVLFVASLPGAIFFGLLSTVARSAETAPPAREAGMTAMAGYVASNVLPPLAPIIARNYVISLALGFGLMLLAVLGSLVWRLSRKREAA